MDNKMSYLGLLIETRDRNSIGCILVYNYLIFEDIQ